MSRAAVLRSGTLAVSERRLLALRDKYRYLFEHSVDTRADGSRHFHRAAHFVREGLHVVSLKGDAFEMAFQHGRLLADAVREGVLAQLSRTVPHLLENSVTKSASLQKLLISVVEVLGKGARPYIPVSYFDETVALSEGAGLPLHEMSNALLAMEALYVLAKHAVRTEGIEVSPLAFGGCSSVAVWGKNTKNGELVVGRNLDYPLNGYFDRFPLVAYHEPTDGGQRYVSLASAGLYTPSLTAFNASGVYLAGHLVPTNETSFRGTPIYFLASEVLRRAKSFDEAVDLFRSFRATLGWAFVLISFREKRVATVEMTHKNFAVRESKDGFHAQTNHFDVLTKANLHINRSVDADSFGRYHVLAKRVDEAAQPFDAQAVARVLGDNFDPVAGRDRTVGATVAVQITVGSAVLCPAEGRFYVATGTAPVSHNRYVEMPFPDRFDSDTFATESYAALAGNDFARRHPKKALGLREYIVAKTAFEYRSAVDESIGALERALAFDPDEDAYRFVLAVLYLRGNRDAEAKVCLDRLAKGAATPHLTRLGLYLRARMAASSGQKAAASADIAAVLASGAVDKKLRVAAERVERLLRRSGTVSWNRAALVPLFQFADLLHY